ncbi:PARN [Cordylochernes scorpioides]|uniref:PARN n=1 Tax=Cordylochernes scorpioides TaxID=51811 RepID=A0ABY6LQ95_9ARAC|nr:PARN [Cordylochernes scorpioides]
MQVTRNNFEATLPIIKEAIENADFLSIDGEFTGIETKNPLNPKDTSEERYKAISKDFDFILIQYGLCAFKFNKQTGCYEYKAFNFYIFSHQESRPTFSAQKSSLEFLASNGFDFGKLYQEGIPYLDNDRYNKLKTNLQKKHLEQEKDSKMNLDNSILEVNEEFVEDFRSKLKDILKSEDQKSSILEPLNPSENLKLSTCTAPSNVDKDKKIEKNTENTNNYLQELKTRQNQELKELENSRGFSKVIEMIANSGKVVVGHNMLLDILHTVHQFVAPLPQSYTEFKTLAKTSLNCFFDTKYITSTKNIKTIVKNTSLPGLIRRMRKDPFTLENIKASPGFEEYSLNKSTLHEAGYDAVITGAVLIGIHRYLCKRCGRKEIISSKSRVLSIYLNNVFVMFSENNSMYFQ